MLARARRSRRIARKLGRCLRSASDTSGAARHAMASSRPAVARHAPDRDRIRTKAARDRTSGRIDRRSLRHEGDTGPTHVRGRHQSPEGRAGGTSTSRNCSSTQTMSFTSSIRGRNPTSPLHTRGRYPPRWWLEILDGAAKSAYKRPARGS
jgi:hypothetical protein